MKRILERRPSPALVIACMALFVALGGVSYGVATGSIDSREIQDGSVRNADFKKGTLRGNEAKPDGFGGGAIKESTLGEVPKAENADQLGGQGADRYKTRWALIDEQGQIEQQTGGFALRDCFVTNTNCYLDAGEDVRDNGIHAQIAIQNNDAVPDSSRLSGETGVAPCGAAFVTCAPPNTEDNNVLVVAPRDSAGATVTAGSRFRFYVFVTGSTP